MTQFAAMTPGLAESRESEHAVNLSLLNAFELRCAGDAVEMPPSAQRLLALLALRERPLLRPYVAGVLWLDSPEERASANLRSSLWRVNRPGPKFVEATPLQLRLAPDVCVDVREMASVAHRLLGASHLEERSELDFDPTTLTGELLPDWYEDWVLLERERLRQLSLHALEALGERLLAVEKIGEALETALAAIEMEPLRESSHRLLIRIHLREGNPAEALRHYRFCSTLFRDQLGVAPSQQLTELVETLTN